MWSAEHEGHSARPQRGEVNAHACGKAYASSCEILVGTVNPNKNEMSQQLFVKLSNFFFLWRFDTILGHGFPLRGFAITFLVTSYSIEILWTSDQADEDTST